MNLIELENLVKGAPDEYLVKEVQQPTGKVPPFLALSEIQRRKDMRDRYLAQTNEAPKPTIANRLKALLSLPLPLLAFRPLALLLWPLARLPCRPLKVCHRALPQAAL